MVQDTETPAAKPRRRVLRRMLWVLLFCAPALMILLGAIFISSVEPKFVLINRVEDSGGWVGVTHPLGGWGRKDDDNLSLPAKLLGRITYIHVSQPILTGEDLIRIGGMSSLEVISLYLAPGTTEEDLLPIVSLPRLKWLNIYEGVATTERGMEMLSRLDSLESLAIGAPSVPPSGLLHFAQSPNLSRITLWKTTVDAGLARALQNLKSLKRLRLLDCVIEDEAVEFLQMPQGVALDLENPSLTADGFRRLSSIQSLDKLTFYERHGPIPPDAFRGYSGVSRLRRIWIEDPALDDAMLERIAGIDTLERLSSESNSLTDAGLMHLHGRKNLKEVSLSGSFSAEAIAELKKSLPGTKVYVSNPAVPIPTPTSQK